MPGINRSKAKLPPLPKKRKRFEVPNIQEVTEYITTKKPEWPLNFVLYYAEKFWNHYEASGWKLSNGNQVKNWQACFNANWQNLKFAEDISALQKYLHQKAVKPIVQYDVQEMNGKPITNHSMNEFLKYYTKNYDKVDLEYISRFYYWMKERGFMLVTGDEVEAIKISYGDDRQKCRGACVKITLDKMQINSINF